MLFMSKPHESCRRASGLGAVLVAAAFLTGCPDPQAEFDEFASRYESTKPPPVEAACGVTVQQIEGTFFFALAAKIAKTNPISFLNTITTEADGMHFSVQPLNEEDRKTPVGEPVELGPYPIDAEGNFEAAFPELTIPGEANPISDAPIIATTTLHGAVCEDLLCGDVSGAVTKPIPIPDLSGGSTFTMARVEGDAYPPDPVIVDCAGTEAAPP